MARSWTLPDGAELERQLTEADRRGAEADRIEPRAAAARYDGARGYVVLDLASGCTLSFPVEASPSAGKSRTWTCRSPEPWRTSST